MLLNNSLGNSGNIAVGKKHWHVLILELHPNLNLDHVIHDNGWVEYGWR